jgi:3-hydroxyacyl-[acyl-carrier-protein] dehydratase
MKPEEIISLLPYAEPFLFVDNIIKIDENSVTGEYTFRKDDFFYKEHFKDHPVTPGVILTETMAQIGIVCLGIFLLKDKISLGSFPGIPLTSSKVDFFLTVFPEEKVTVTSNKVYFRFGKLKCQVEMRNSKGEVICKGFISGMLKDKD